LYQQFDGDSRVQVDAGVGAVFQPHLALDDDHAPCRRSDRRTAADATCRPPLLNLGLAVLMLMPAPPGQALERAPISGQRLNGPRQSARLAARFAQHHETRVIGENEVSRTENGNTGRMMMRAAAPPPGAADQRQQAKMTRVTSEISGRPANRGDD